MSRAYCGSLNPCVFSQENRRTLVKLSEVVHGSLKYCLYVTYKYSLLYYVFCIFLRCIFQIQ